jgi:hypothetical protein
MPEHKPQVKIISKGWPHNTEIWVDGKQLTCVRAIRWSIDVNERATVQLELDDIALEVTGELTELELEDLRERISG